ncbi:hypothetical protein ACFX15_023508 [Malus domestica]
MSAKRKLGFSSSRSCSSGSWSKLVALRKLVDNSGEGSELRYSQPSGRPASTEGNLMVLISTLTLPELISLD